MLLPDVIVSKILTYWNPDYDYMDELKKYLIIHREHQDEMMELFGDWCVCHSSFGALMYVRSDCV
tara:strand:+ start:3007 stop:3201 length:195 start_codon:yes stop_codon:yes gene_type:complete